MTFRDQLFALPFHCSVPNQNSKFKIRFVTPYPKNVTTFVTTLTSKITRFYRHCYDVTTSRGDHPTPSPRTLALTPTLTLNPYPPAACVATCDVNVATFVATSTSKILRFYRACCDVATLQGGSPRPLRNLNRARNRNLAPPF